MSTSCNIPIPATGAHLVAAGANIFVLRKLPVGRMETPNKMKQRKDMMKHANDKG